MSGAINIHYEWAKVPQTEKDADADTDTETESKEEQGVWVGLRFYGTAATRQQTTKSEQDTHISPLPIHTYTHLKERTCC